MFVCPTVSELRFLDVVILVHLTTYDIIYLQCFEKYYFVFLFVDVGDKQYKNTKYKELGLYNIQVDR